MTVQYHVRAQVVDLRSDGSFEQPVNLIDQVLQPVRAGVFTEDGLEYVIRT